MLISHIHATFMLACQATGILQFITLSALHRKEV